MTSYRTREKLTLDDVKWALGKLELESRRSNLEMSEKGFFDICPVGKVPVPDLLGETGLSIEHATMQGALPLDHWRGDQIQDTLLRMREVMTSCSILELSRPVASETGGRWDLLVGTWKRGPFVGWKAEWREQGRGGEMVELAVEELGIPAIRSGRSYKHLDGDVLEISSIASYETRAAIRCAIADQRVPDWVEKFGRFRPWKNDLAIHVRINGQFGAAHGVWNSARSVFATLDSQQHHAWVVLRELADLEALRDSAIPLSGSTAFGSCTLESDARFNVWVRTASGTDGGHQLDIAEPEYFDRAELEDLLEMSFVRVRTEEV